MLSYEYLKFRYKKLLGSYTISTVVLPTGSLPCNYMVGLNRYLLLCHSISMKPYVANIFHLGSGMQLGTFQAGIQSTKGHIKLFERNYGL